MHGHCRAREPVKADPKSIVTGTSVLGLKYKDGVMVASDMQLSYGSYAKYKNLPRIFKVADSTLIASSGEYSNMQVLTHRLQLELEELNRAAGDEKIFGPRECFEIVKRQMYKKRCKGNPEMNFHIIAGVEHEARAASMRGELLPFEEDPSRRFLGGVNHLGNFYQASVIASGIGSHIALPILRNRVEGRENDITREDGLAILEECMKVLFYRDVRASNSVQVGYIEGSATEIVVREVSSQWGIGQL